jgi:RimJ/RimL family protein N-acetyltransferase
MRMSDSPGNTYKGLRIRLLERQELEDARRLHNDDSTLLWLTDIRHVSEPEQEDWFKALSQDQSTRRYSIFEEQSGEFAGLFRVDHLDLQNRGAMVGLDIVPEFRRRGYARKVFEYFFQYLFDEVGLNRLGLVTLDSNTPAVELYRKLGFQKEGRHREAVWRDGRHQDLLQFGLLRDEYKASGQD